MKTILLLACFVCVTVLLVGCTTSKQEDAESPPETQSRPPAAQTPAPGTANVAAVVLGYEEKEHHYLTTLKIEQVEGYGAGAPALPVGTEIAVVISKALFDEDPDGAKAAATLATDQSVAATLQYSTAAAVGDEPPPPSWRALAIR